MVPKERPAYHRHSIRHALKHRVTTAVSHKHSHRTMSQNLSLRSPTHNFPTFTCPLKKPTWQNTLQMLLQRPQKGKTTCFQRFRHRHNLMWRRCHHRPKANIRHRPTLLLVQP
ncbi:hypothetical protein VIGAN_05025300 [Vigna angularis var. angularis]|uniref:Uncharacterized protein n=1 Tax=Vigna angularis var. angularis TaxID=157739 RepID=A0A0S3S254_PHAAN|nr:hypothetical protein VIGAN_05025300 [Vigna angularis var. angularis]